MESNQKKAISQTKNRPIYKYQLQGLDFLNDEYKYFLEKMKSVTSLTLHFEKKQQERSAGSYNSKPDNPPSTALSPKQDPPKRPENISCDSKPQKHTVKKTNKLVHIGSTKSKKSKKKEKMVNPDDFLDKEALFNSEDDGEQSSYEASAEERKSMAYSKRESLGDLGDLGKRQRRGLSQISLIVKNIVARIGKMTFRDVAEAVLSELSHYLPISEPNRSKQIKNIKRRVYDALNVLISVGILAKEQRCVVCTQHTSIPGKTLSENWQTVRQQQRQYEQKLQNYKKYQANLNLLLDNYNKMQEFYDRNARYDAQQQKNKPFLLESQSEQQPLEQKKLHFPLMLMVPPEDDLSKVKVEIELLDEQDEYYQKNTILGSDYLLTDLDLLRFLDLESDDEEQLSAIKQFQIEDVLGSPKNFKEQQFPNKNSSAEKGKSRKSAFEDDIFLSD